jgi:hypothetical protein
MSLRTILILASLSLIGGCATMSEQECMVSDWRTIGFEDGSRGYTADRIGSYRQACSEHGVTPDLAEYREGRREGLEEFCRPQNGFNVGSAGRSYAGVCPAEQESDFVTAYNEGRRLHDLRSKVSSANSQIASLNRQIAEVEEQIDAHEDMIVADDTNTLERARLLLEAKDLIDERKDLEHEIDRLESERRVYQKELDDYRETVAYNVR